VQYHVCTLTSSQEYWETPDILFFVGGWPHSIQHSLLVTPQLSKIVLWYMPNRRVLPFSITALTRLAVSVHWKDAMSLVRSIFHLIDLFICFSSIPQPFIQSHLCVSTHRVLHPRSFTMLEPLAIRFQISYLVLIDMPATPADALQSGTKHGTLLQPIKPPYPRTMQVLLHEREKSFLYIRVAIVVLLCSAMSPSSQLVH
jgi:hypothetical protein